MPTGSDLAGPPSTRHNLPVEQFGQLCAGLGGPDTVRLLWRSQLSRRLLLLKALFDELTRNRDLVGPLPDAGDAWRVLSAAREVATDEVDALLLHPHVGGWIAYVLRRRRGGASSAAPQWIDIGGVHTLALTAAARCGLSWRTSVPIRQGCVLLPGLGLGRFPDAQPWDLAQAWTEDRRIWLRWADIEIAVPSDASQDADGWWGLRHVDVDAGLRLSVALDDVSPFRDLADPVPPVRLDRQTVDRWTELLTQAWTVLCRDHRDTAEALSAGVTSVVPLPTNDRWETRSASTGDAFGCVMVSQPPDPVTLAVALVHEFQHIKLGGLIHLVPLSTDAHDGQYHYAPWRDDPRPLGGLLQGIYAFVGIAAFWRVQRTRASGVDGRYASFEYAYARAQADEALQAIQGSPSLTAMGHAVVDGLVEMMRPWFSDVLPVDICELVSLVSAGHRAGWRVRYRRPDVGAVTALADAWRMGIPDGVMTVTSTVTAAAPERWSQGRLGLARRLVVDAGIMPAPATTVRGASWSDRLLDADLALFAGDTEAAKQGYLAGIAANPDEFDAWSGLGLALSVLQAGPAGSVLLEQPDLVRSTYAEISARQQPPDPAALAEWIAGATLAEADPLPATEASGPRRSPLSSSGPRR